MIKSECRLIVINRIAVSMSQVGSRLCRLYGMRNLLYEKLSVEESFSEAFIECLSIYSQKYSPKNRPIILMIVPDCEQNFSDQVIFESNMYMNGIKVVRMTFLKATQKLEFINERVFVGSDEVAIMYYRTNYDPPQYNNDILSLRKSLENFLAVNVPNGAIQLLGCKVVQALMSDDVLKRHLNERDTYLVASFFKNCNLINEDMIREIKKRPSDYVLKP